MGGSVPRGPAPGWRARKQPVLDSHILAAVNAAGGVGKHNAGHYGELVIDGLDPIRPGLGDVIAIRGDVGHRVEDVTAGERFMMKATVTTPTTRR